MTVEKGGIMSCKTKRDECRTVRLLPRKFWRLRPHNVQNMCVRVTPRIGCSA